MNIVALYSVKGGVGKTAAAVNLAHAAAAEGWNTLLVDLDHQGASSFYFRVRPKRKFDRKTLLKGGKKVESAIRATDFENLDILPADFTYRKLDLTLGQMRKPRSRLDRVVRPAWVEYDAVFLDCPPSLNLAAENVFRVADFVLTPLVPTTLSMRSDRMLRRFFDKNGLDLRKIVAFFSMVERRKKLHREVVEAFAASEHHLLATAIPYAAEVERMGVHREPVHCYAPACPAAVAYRALWRDVRRLFNHHAL